MDVASWPLLRLGLRLRLLLEVAHCLAPRRPLIRSRSRPLPLPLPVPVLVVVAPLPVPVLAMEGRWGQALRCVGGGMEG